MPVTVEAASVRAVSASPRAIWLALGTVYVVWGSTYLAIRVLVGSAPPLVSMGTRFLAAGALLGAFLVWRSGWRVLRMGRRQLASASLVGLLLILGGNGLVALAERTVPSGLTALLISATPLWLLCLRTATGDRPRAASWLGTLLGFAGILLLSRPGSSGAHVETWGVALILVASFSWAVGSFLAGRLPMPVNTLAATVVEMLVAGVVQLVIGVARGELRGFPLSAVTPQAWLAWAYLVTAGSLLGYSAYVWLLDNARISLVATYAYVNPVVAVFLGALLLQEPVTSAILTGGVVVLLGVFLVVSIERPRQLSAADELQVPAPADRVG